MGQRQRQRKQLRSLCREYRQTTESLVRTKASTTAMVQRHRRISAVPRIRSIACGSQCVYTRESQHTNAATPLCGQYLPGVPSNLSRYNSQPRTSHLTAAKRVLRYLRKTADHSLHFNGNGNDGEITGYTDSDWANDSADQKSQGGHVFLCNGGAISWQSRKQDLVAPSTTEAEHTACSEAS